ncbi:peptidoglycan-binding domain-containing protein [Thermomonas sp.]|jgi:hypothetical protein|uniref:peptidoglycan-binding domain-containing protein n=1 Tax=Thermomonas sp. TaxID=1971895 RepID=UPI002C791A6E|nr:peptidoglycan-binding domain-containing protein [Thermomonas sp.]
MPFNYQVLKANNAGNDKDAVKKFMEAFPVVDPDFDPPNSGKYDNDCADQLKIWQLNNGLVSDGVCGPNTWRAILGEDWDFNYRHAPSEVFQPTKRDCWRAAAATVLRVPMLSVPLGTAQYDNGGLNNAEGNLRTFASEHGLVYKKVSMSAGSLAFALGAYKRFMVNVNDDYAGKVPGNNTHWMVLHRIRTDFWMTSGGTSVTFWDPMPVGQGQDKRTLSFAKFAQFYICHMHRPN